MCEDERVLAEKTLDEGLTHSETLMPLIDETLNSADTDISEIGLVAAVNGPGSFTGLRIGLCAAKGICRTLGIPACAIDTLALLAENEKGFDGLIVPMLDARRGQVYAAVFENGKRVTADAACPVEDIVKLTGDRKTIFVGDGAVALKDKILGIRPDAVFSENNFPLAKNAAALIKSTPKTDAFSLMPEYLRESQAERKKNER